MVPEAYSENIKGAGLAVAYHVHAELPRPLGLEPDSEVAGIPKLLTTQDVGRILRIPARAALHLVTSGLLPAIYLPAKQIRISPDALRKFIAEAS